MGMDAKFFELDTKMEAVRQRLAGVPAAIRKDYEEKLDISWLYHDNALEGVVLSYSELKAAIDKRIITDVTLIPMVEEVRAHKAALDFVHEAATGKRPVPVDLELVKKIYGICTPEQMSKGLPFRKENPLHRLYYHEIASPEKIAPRMRKLEEWLESSEFRELHPVSRAVKAHFRLLSIYPWTKNSGKVARLLMNFLLLRYGYLPTVIHHIERQRYYESLRLENDTLPTLVVDSLNNSIETTLKFFEEIEGLRVRRAS